MNTPDHPTDVPVRMRQMLFELLQRNGSNPFETAEAIPDNVDLSTIGINSVDFLEFSISVEQEFEVAILDTIDPDALPLTLEAWQQQVCMQSASQTE